MKNLTSTAIKTQLYKRSAFPNHLQHPLLPFLFESLKGLALEGAVLAITSKIVSLSEGATVSGSIDKRTLVKREADQYLGEGGYGIELTIKHGLLIPSAGIDESNSEVGDYILFPKDPFASAQLIWQGLRDHFGLRQLGVILTDSHTTPLRMGVTGIALSYWGFRGVSSKVDEPDLYGRKLKFTHIDVVDALAVSAVLVMGEAGECTPLALVNVDSLEYVEVVDPSEIRIPLEKDLYFPMLRASIE